jgi:hypothetical protein
LGWKIAELKAFNGTSKAGGLNLINKDRSGPGYNDLNNFVDLYHAESAAKKRGKWIETKHDDMVFRTLGTPKRHQLPPLPRKEKSKCDAKAEKAVITITEQYINISIASIDKLIMAFYSMYIKTLR